MRETARQLHGYGPFQFPIEHPNHSSPPVAVASPIHRLPSRPCAIGRSRRDQGRTRESKGQGLRMGDGWLDWAALERINALR
jgi:hypothetical protein